MRPTTAIAHERYRPDLPTIPARMLTLPITRGFPTPWFVGQVDGEYDFRLIGPGKLTQAVKGHLCWVCGQRLGRNLVFCLGPMCCINRTISEPPSHKDCTEFSVKACPFLTQREAERRTAGLPDPEQLTQAAGLGLSRQPGVICLWTTRSYRPFPAYAGQPGVLFRPGKPTQLAWYREGREATLPEIWESVATGLPGLRNLAKQEGTPAVLALEQSVERFMDLMPGLRDVERELEEA